MKNRIARIREERGLSQVRLAELVGTSGQMIGMLEAGKRGLTLRWMERLAKALDVFPAELIDDANALHPISVIGVVEAGIWKHPAHWPIDRQYAVSIPLDPAYGDLPVFALEVHGPSMNEVYPDGAILVCIPFSRLDPAEHPLENRRYVVRRVRSTGEIETTVKEYATHPDGIARLWPRSAHPDYRTPLVLGDGSDGEITLYGLVIGSYIPE